MLTQCLQMYDEFVRIFLCLTVWSKDFTVSFMDCFAVRVNKALFTRQRNTTY